jgi:glycosyltransferase involved in cell wall biosynthesis
MLMKEFAGLGYRSVMITSDSNKLAQTPKLHGPYLKQDVDGVELWWVRTLKYRVAKSMRRIISWFDFEWCLWKMNKAALHRPDVLIVSSLSLLTILNGFWLRKRYGCRLIFEVRDIWPLTVIEAGGFSARNPFIKVLSFIEYLGYRYSDAIVGTMPNLREHVTKVLGYERPVACIPMGIESTILNDRLQVPPDYVAKYLSVGKFMVAYVGSIGIANALDTFLDCAESLVSNKEIHFLVVGDGDLRDQYITKYSHLPNLTFAPQVPKAMVQAVLAKFDLLYFSTHMSRRWRYGQSLNKIVDYMLSGKPIVASYSGYPSMINEAGAGTYVESDDISALGAEIIRYLALPSSERQDIGARGRDWIIANRSYQTLAKGYLSILFPEQGLNGAAKT